MSLHKFAEQVASQGRGDDSLLVHMTPDEVRNLQQFAQANGTTLTINPTTGLPEAGLLSDLFKSIAPIALGAFLGPAGLGMSSMMAGVATGGITTLATGSLSRGLMAGLGAYGGAGLGESFMTAGGNAMVAGGAPVGAENLVGGVSSSGATAGSAVSVPPIEQVNPSNFNLAKSDVLSAGAKAAAANPMAFAKQNLGNLAYAAAPIAAGMMVPTTTKLPDPKDTGYIRQFAYNINPDTGKPDPLYGMRAMTPVKASEFGNKTLQGQRDLFYQQNQNQNPYQLGVGSLNQPPQQQQQPTPMASGGIVALANGGVPGYANGMLVGDQDVFNYFKGLDQSKLASGALDAQIAADMQKYNVGAADIGRITGTQANQGDYEKRFVQAVNTPTTSAPEFLAMTSDVGLKDQALADALKRSGMSAAAQYAATHTLDDTAGIASAPKAAQDFYNAYGYTAGSAPGDQGGLEGLYANIGYSANKLQDQINAGTLTVAKAQNLSLAEMERLGINQADVEAATGKKFGNLFTEKPIVTKVTGGGGNDVITGTGTGGTGTGVTTVTPQPFTSVIPGGFYGNATNPGDITTNKDGTVTVHPNIPYREQGGFSGMGEVRDAYTKGGGSLGYTAPIPKDPQAAFNKMTDDSLDAYNFLMGKGKNLTQRKAETRDRPVMARYDEAVLGKKAVPRAKTTTTAKTVTGVPGQPQTYFNEAEYLAANPDVAAELKSGKSNFTSAYEHYLMYGKKEGRPFTGDYEGYTTAAALANAANATNTGGGGDGPAPPGPDADSTSPANSDAGNTVAKNGGLMPRGYAMGGGLGCLGSYSDGGRLLRGPGDGVSDSIPATIGRKNQPARLADGEFVIPARIVSELGNGSTDAGAKKLYAMMDRVQRARGKTTGKNKVAANSRADKYLPA
jgi:hypothetical protein